MDITLVSVHYLSRLCSNQGINILQLLSFTVQFLENDDLDHRNVEYVVQ